MYILFVFIIVLSIFHRKRRTAWNSTSSWHDPSNFFKRASECFSLSKSRTVGRTRCDCFHTQEVITPDLPQLWLRLINIDKQLMRCQAGTRPFRSCYWWHQWRGKMTSTANVTVFHKCAAKVANYLQWQSEIIGGTAGLFTRLNQSGHYGSLWRYHSS